MSLPKSPVILPADLVNVTNGALPDSIMRTVGPAGGRLHHLAARAFGALVVAGAAAGHSLTYTPGGCYRTFQQQSELFSRRWTTRFIAGRPTTDYAGQRWYLMRGMARAARPGTSNHGFGLAVDYATGATPAAATSLTPAALRWIIANAGSLGWSAELDSEPWHWRYVAGDRLPQRVLDIEQFLAAVSKP
jgi:LAS superfamily LD-carboxypeptidase LdcB